MVARGLRAAAGRPDGRAPLRGRRLHPAARSADRGAGGGEADEVLYVLAGSGRARIGGRSTHAPPRNRAVRPGRYRLVRERGRQGVSVLVHEPGPSPGPRWSTATAVEKGTRPPAASSCSARRRGLHRSPSSSASIPPGRAPDHFHRYDEVIYVLEGEGVLESAASRRRAAARHLHPPAEDARPLPREHRRAVRCACSASSVPRARPPRRTTPTARSPSSHRQGVTMPRIERTHRHRLGRKCRPRGTGTITGADGAFTELPFSLPSRIAAPKARRRAPRSCSQRRTRLPDDVDRERADDGRHAARPARGDCTIVMDEVEGQGHQIVASHVTIGRRRRSPADDASSAPTRAAPSRAAQEGRRRGDDQPRLSGRISSPCSSRSGGRAPDCRGRRGEVRGERDRPHALRLVDHVEAERRRRAQNASSIVCTGPAGTPAAASRSAHSARGRVRQRRLEPDAQRVAVRDAELVRREPRVLCEPERRALSRANCASFPAQIISSPSAGAIGRERLDRRVHVAERRAARRRSPASPSTGSRAARGSRAADRS